MQQGGALLFFGYLNGDLGGCTDLIGGCIGLCEECILINLGDLEPTTFKSVAIRHDDLTDKVDINAIVCPRVDGDLRSAQGFGDYTKYLSL